ncbi:50S ribosomal protein L24 [Candidatus Micrarchaeota archaeon CG10_big_fil_rev_8_21_14_0_10_45_29]|nr:MAG: 50S ribosomal protein L24 [Candidatus Micrarchaeota archaeon CG10_big_fil_rev_8_21_14_0_10_45_29]
MATKTKQPRKQRKMRANAPMHVRKKLMHVHVSKALRQKNGSKRSVLVKKGDKIKVLCGSNKGKTGIVMEADYKDLMVYVEGIVRRNSKAAEKLVPIRPSIIEIIDGDFSSPSRKRGGASGAKEAQKEQSK